MYKECHGTVLRALILLEEWPTVVCKKEIPLDKLLMVFFESSNPIGGMADYEAVLGWRVVNTASRLQSVRHPLHQVSCVEFNPSFTSKAFCDLAKLKM